MSTSVLHRPPRVGLVLKPVGRRGRRAHRLLAESLAACGAPPPLVLRTTIGSPGTIQTAALVRSGVDIVVVAGGDGTVRAAVPALAGTGVPLAVLPTGTANLFARNMGLSPRRLSTAVRTVLEGRQVACDIGQVWVRTITAPESQGPLPFLVMAGIGRDARTVAATGLRLKAGLGWLAYLAAGAREALQPGVTMLVDLVGEARERRLWTVLFGNLPQIPGGIAVFPDARPDDGLLECLAVPLRHAGQWLPVACHGLFGRPRRTGALEYSRVAQARILPAEPQPVQLDGDVVPDVVELEIGVAAGALRVLLPPT